MSRHPRLVLAGDYNIAPEDRDAHPDWKDEIHVSEPERAAFAPARPRLIDAFRLFEHPEKELSWWDYRMMAFAVNFGLRIDHLLVSPHCANAAGRAKSTRRRASSNALGPRAGGTRTRLMAGDCGVVLVHGKWGKPPYEHARRWLHDCSPKVIESGTVMPWALARRYDLLFERALDEIEESAR